MARRATGVLYYVISCGGVYIYIMYTCICVYTHLLSSCPAGHLRHRAYCILCFFCVEVLQKPNPQNHKNCKKKRSKLCKNHAKSTPSGSFWGDFGVILVPLGVLWRPWAPQGTSQGSRGEKTTKKGVRGPPPGTPFGDPGATLGAIGPTFSSFLGVG